MAQILCEFRTEQLLDEYREAELELMKRKSYVNGLVKAIEEEAYSYYSQFENKRYRISFKQIWKSDIDAQINKICVNSGYLRSFLGK